MRNLVLFAGTGRTLGLPITISKEVTAVQLIYRIKSKDNTFIFGMMPLLQEFFRDLTFDDLNDSYVPYGRRSTFSGEDWEAVIELNNGVVPINIYMAKEGQFLKDDEVALVVETTDERFAWAAHYLDSIIEHHLKRVVQMGCAALKLRMAVRESVVKYSDREATDLSKLFLLPPATGMTVNDMELFGAFLKVVSPHENSPASVKYLADHYLPASFPPNASVSADAESPIGIDFSERLATILGKTKNRHLNLYVKPENDEVVAEQLMRFKEILEDRNTPLVICLEEGDMVVRAKEWMENFSAMVGLEQNGMGLEYPSKQFGLGLLVDSDEQIKQFCDEMAKAGYTIDGLSFMVRPEIVEIGKDATVEKRFAYKLQDWDKNHIEHSLPLQHQAGLNEPNTSLSEVVNLIIDQVEKTHPHDFSDDDAYPGRYSGWWIRKVVRGGQ